MHKNDFNVHVFTVEILYSLQTVQINYVCIKKDYEIQN